MYVRGYLQGSKNGRVVTIGSKGKQVKSAPNQIGPKSNRPQVKSALVKSAPSQIGPSQIGPIFVAYYCQHAKLNSLNTIQQNI